MLTFWLQRKWGKYVIKIFSKERSPQSVKSYIHILEEAQQIGVPVAQLVAGAKGNVSIVSENTRTPYCITEFFERDDFQEKSPTMEDMVRVAYYLAKLNTLNFPVVETYDSWGNKNLVAEYDKNQKKLTAYQNTLIAPVARGVKSLDFFKFSLSVIHGDMQRKHVLKNTKGEYCLLDFGCAANGPKVIELSTYLAWFCLSMSANIIEAYSSVHHLSQYELDSLPILVRAVYAAYYLRTCILIKEGDRSGETAEWNKNAFCMLASGAEY